MRSNGRLVLEVTDHPNLFLTEYEIKPYLIEAFLSLGLGESFIAKKLFADVKSIRRIAILSSRTSRLQSRKGPRLSYYRAKAIASMLREGEKVAFIRAEYHCSYATIAKVRRLMENKQL